MKTKKYSKSWTFRMKPDTLQKLKELSSGKSLNVTLEELINFYYEKVDE